MIRDQVNTDKQEKQKHGETKWGYPQHTHRYIQGNTHTHPGGYRCLSQGPLDMSTHQTDKSTL